MQYKCNIYEWILMEKEKLKELIIEHKSRFLTRSDLIKRELQGELSSFLSQRYFPHF